MVEKGWRILHLVDSAGMYGAEHVILELLEGLKASEAKVALGCLSPLNTPGAEIGNISKKLGIPVYFVNEQKRASLGGLLRIYGAIKDSKAEILHAHGYKATILGGFIAKCLGIPLMATYHGEASKALEISNYLRIETPFIRGARKIIAVSRRIKEELINRGVQESKIAVIYNGITDRYKGKARFLEKKENSESFPHLLCVGRLVDIKRYDLVIDAIGYLRRKYPGIGLSIAGSGPLEETLRKRAEGLGVTSSVRFHGFVDETENLYQSADIFVLPSETEGTPISLIEAMAASLPIVSTSVGSIPEILSHGREAHIIPPNNLGMLISAIDCLVTNENYRRILAENVRVCFEKDFSAEIMVRSYCDQYKEVLAG